MIPNFFGNVILKPLKTIARRLKAQLNIASKIICGYYILRKQHKFYFDFTSCSWTDLSLVMTVDLQELRQHNAMNLENMHFYYQETSINKSMEQSSQTGELFWIPFPFVNYDKCLNPNET